jgi:hypothetical protein
MTHRGSLIYYFTAWILGCFFMSVAIWIRSELYGDSFWSPAFPGLLSLYFFALVLGAIPSLIAAFLLRKVASIFKCKTPAHWAIFGAIVIPLVVGGLERLRHFLPIELHTPQSVLSWFTSGPRIVVMYGWWLAIPAGAATGYFLGRVQRAFDPGRVYAAVPKQPNV